MRKHLLEARAYATIAISAITEAEIRYGLERRPGNTRLAANFDRFFSSVTSLAWDSTTAEAYGRLRAQLGSQGKTLSLMDLLIAAQAIAANAVLVSHDQAFPQARPLLRVVDWAEDV